MVVLTLGIIFIHYSVRGATRSLGITFLVYGAIEYAGLYVSRIMGLFQLPLTGIPRTFQSWVPQFLRDVIYPHWKYSAWASLSAV